MLPYMAYIRILWVVLEKKTENTNGNTMSWKYQAILFVGFQENTGDVVTVNFQTSSIFLSKERYLSHQHQSLPNTYELSIMPRLLTLFPFAILFKYTWAFPTIIGLTTINYSWLKTVVMRRFRIDRCFPKGWNAWLPFCIVDYGHTVKRIWIHHASPFDSPFLRESCLHHQNKRGSEFLETNHQFVCFRSNHVTLCNQWTVSRFIVAKFFNILHLHGSFSTVGSLYGPKALGNKSGKCRGKWL